MNINFYIEPNSVIIAFFLLVIGYAFGWYIHQGLTK